VSEEFVRASAISCIACTKIRLACAISRRARRISRLACTIS